MKLSALMTIIAVLLCEHAAAQERTPQTLIATRMDSLRAARAAAAPVTEGHMSLSRLGEEQSFVGDVDGASATFDLLSRSRKPQPVTDDELAALEGLRSEDAVKAIVAAARGKRAVLLNEAHHIPMHRAFAQKLAGELRKAGFTHLAAETFYPSVAANPKYTTDQTGYYTREPVFAGFINAALADGWQLIDYEPISSEAQSENPLDSIRRREEGQVRNLLARVFDSHPEARVFIYVGYAHVTKRPGPDGLKWMGTLLREKLGDGATLHIDQTVFYAHSERTAEHPLYRPVLARFPSSSAFVLRRPEGAFSDMPRTLPGGADMQVIHPEYGYRYGRPGWMICVADRKPMPIPATLLPSKGERLILAYPKKFGTDAMPVDAVLIEAGKPAPSLMVPDGDIRIRIEE